MSLTFPRSNSGGVVVNVYEAIISAFKIRVSSEIHKSSSENSGGDIAGALGLLLDSEIYLFSVILAFYYTAT